MKRENRVPAGPGLNRGGRPRKDGTKTDPSLTYKDLSISKREAARMRRLGKLSDDEFEAMLDMWRAYFMSGSRCRSVESFLPDPRANSRAKRETAANVARIISAAKAIAKAHKIDAGRNAGTIRQVADMTIDLWTALQNRLLAEED